MADTELKVIVKAKELAVHSFKLAVKAELAEMESERE